MSGQEHDQEGRRLAVGAARKSLGEGGIPIGAAIIGHDGRVLSTGHNQRIQKRSTVLHGEMDALENTGILPASELRSATLFTTLSPCSMCTGAILLYGIPRVVVLDSEGF
ncbi:MAG: nucleoside deaminase, partial [archaeon]|nr:nucleoside deaminase [archaeon]